MPLILINNQLSEERILIINYNDNMFNRGT